MAGVGQGQYKVFLRGRARTQERKMKMKQDDGRKEKKANVLYRAARLYSRPVSDVSDNWICRNEARPKYPVRMEPSVGNNNLFRSSRFGLVD